MCSWLLAAPRVESHPVQDCISSVDSRIPQGRSRASSYSSSVFEGVVSSPSSSRAASPARDTSASSQVPAPAASLTRIDSLTKSLAHVPIADSTIDHQPSSDPNPSPAPPAAAPPYVYVAPPAPPSAALQFLTTEIDDVCDEYASTPQHYCRFCVLNDADCAGAIWRRQREACGLMSLKTLSASCANGTARLLSHCTPATTHSIITSPFVAALSNCCRYGSFSTGLCDRDSDVDLLIATPAAVAYMQKHNVFETTSLPPPPLPPVMLDDLFILIQVCVCARVNICFVRARVQICA